MQAGSDKCSVNERKAEMSGLADDIDSLRTIFDLPFILLGNFNFQLHILGGTAAVSEKKRG